MKVDLRSITAEGCELSYSGISDELELFADGFNFPQPIEVTLTATKSGDEILLQGLAASKVEMECARCLELFEMEISARMQFVIQLLDINGPQPSEDDDFVILPKTTGEYDISQRIRESILLELPLKPLCSESCRGLCPMCGANLNETECDCAPDKTDERWDSLKQLFGQ